MMDNMSGGERLIAFGGLAIVASFVIFELMVREYFVSGLVTLAGSLLVATVWLKHNRPDTEWGAPYGWILRTLAYVTAFLGLLELIDDIRFDNLDESSAVIGGLLVYAGSVMAFLGARQMKSEG